MVGIWAIYLEIFFIALFLSIYLTISISEHEAGDLEFRYAWFEWSEAERDFKPGTVEDEFFILQVNCLKMLSGCITKWKFKWRFSNIFRYWKISNWVQIRKWYQRSLFDNLDTRVTSLIGTVRKNKRLSDILNGINSINFGNLRGKWYWCL